ncbi:hypothetical protein Ae201684P_013838 [Aphanomyces euteiches]|nr:hypothetical protein Ae201684P_013838 [Aphanomyces euteiches]
MLRRLRRKQVHGSLLKRGVLKDVWYLPRLSRNLFSVRQFTSQCTSVSFEKNTCGMEKGGTKFAIGERFGKGLYKLKVKPVKAPSTMANLSEDKPNPSKLWNERLGHIGSQGIQALVKNKLSSDMPLKSVQDWGSCDSCALGKQARFKFNKKFANRSAAVLFEEISTDMHNPMQTPSLGGSVYFDLLLGLFVAQEAQFKANIKRLRSDNVREYQNRNFEDYCKAHGIFHHFSPAYTPELNCLAERMNRTLVESARCMMEHAGLLREYRTEAITIAANARSRTHTMPSKIRSHRSKLYLDRSPR